MWVLLKMSYWRCKFLWYKDSLELFNAIKDNQINFDDVVKRQNEFLNKLSNIKIGKKTPEQKEVINNLEKFYNSREEVFNFFKGLSWNAIRCKLRCKK